MGYNKYLPLGSQVLRFFIHPKKNHFVRFYLMYEFIMHDNIASLLRIHSSSTIPYLKLSLLLVICTYQLVLQRVLWLHTNNWRNTFSCWVNNLNSLFYQVKNPHYRLLVQEFCCKIIILHSWLCFSILYFIKNRYMVLVKFTCRTSIFFYYLIISIAQII